MTASRPSSETTQPLTDERLIWRAVFSDTVRIALAVRAGKYTHRHANKAVNRLHRISEEVDAGTLHPAIAALEILRVVDRIPRIAPPPKTVAVATAAVAETPSSEEWEPGDPILHPYDPDPPVIVPMDVDYTPEDWAAIRKAREARNAG